MVTVKEMGRAIQVQILDMVICITHTNNILGKGMNPAILSLAMVEVQTGLFNFSMLSSLRERKL